MNVDVSEEGGGGGTQVDGGVASLVAEQGRRDSLGRRIRARRFEREAKRERAKNTHFVRSTPSRPRGNPCLSVFHCSLLLVLNQ